MAWSVVGLLEIRNTMVEHVLHDSPLLTFNNMSVKYRDQLVLDSLNGYVMPGSLTAILGPNGGGKSTFLKTILGFLVPCKGSLKRKGLTLSEIAYLPQRADIDHSFPLVVRDVVAMGLIQEKGFFSSLEIRCEESIYKALTQVGLKNYSNRSLHTLSGGQFQRVLFARLSLQKSSLILLDEPFSGIDHTTIEDLMRLIISWHQEGKTIMVVTHDFELVRTYFPDSLLLGRKIIAWEKTSEVLTLEHLKMAKKLSSEWENHLELEANNFLTPV
jgi:zinc/manganese transport system ATP-binding protein